MKDKIFGVLQRVGRSFMLPIALLPVAGLLLGIGSSFTNETMLAAYGLNSVIHPGTLIYTILDVMSQTGNAVFSNLALLFAMGVAIGMARKEKEVAALSGAVAYIIMNTAIQAMINAAGGVEAMPANSTTTMLGITTLQMGVFGGIVVGLGVAALHNKFYKIELPQVLAFFGGTRFVPIVSSIVYLVVGIAMFYIWPVVQSGIAALGALVLASGYAGTFIYGLLERALIPFGLHHVFYMPFWQTAVGGTAIIDGVTVTGAQNIFFAELASKATTVFSVSATRFMAGKFPFMMFGLPGAALAMYQCAKPEKKKAAGGLLLSAALTAFLTGITEPLQIEPLADGFVELGNEDVLVYSAYGSKILSLQPSYARPVLAVGGTHFVVYNRAGSELTVCSRTRTLYTQRFDEDILLCAMSNNNSLAVVTDADRFAGWVHIYDPSMRELYSWRMPQSMGTPIALDFAPDNRRFASGMIAARDGQLNCSVYFMSLDSDTEGLLYTADAGSMLLRLDWQSENRVMAVFDTYIAVIDPRTAAEVARYDYGGAALQSVAPGRRQTALLLNVHGGNSLVTLSESLTVMSEIPARQAFAVSATDTDIYLLCPDAVECYGYDGVQNWVQTGLPSRPLAVLHGKQTLVFTGSQADVLAKPAE